MSSFRPPKFGLLLLLLCAINFAVAKRYTWIGDLYKVESTPLECPQLLDNLTTSKVSFKSIGQLGDHLVLATTDSYLFDVPVANLQSAHLYLNHVTPEKELSLDGDINWVISLRRTVESFLLLQVGNLSLGNYLLGILPERWNNEERMYKHGPLSSLQLLCDQGGYFPDEECYNWHQHDYDFEVLHLPGGEVLDAKLAYINAAEELTFYALNTTTSSITKYTLSGSTLLPSSPRYLCNWRSPTKQLFITTKPCFNWNTTPFPLFKFNSNSAFSGFISRGHLYLFEAQQLITVIEWPETLFKNYTSTVVAVTEIALSDFITCDGLPPPMLQGFNWKHCALYSLLGLAILVLILSIGYSIYFCIFFSCFSNQSQYEVKYIVGMEDAD